MSCLSRRGLLLVALLLVSAWAVAQQPVGRTASEAVLWLPYAPHGAAPGTLSPPPTAPPPPSPTATATVAPARTPTSTATSAPTSSPTPTDTPLPTPSPTASDGLTPTPSATPLPPLVTLTAVADTFLTEGRADAVWGAYPGMFVGYDDQLWLRQRALIRFDLSQIPRDALVLAASLEVFIHNCYECRGVDVSAHRATRAWDEMTVTWEAYGDGVGEMYGVTKLRPALVQTWVSVDVTGLIQAWQRGTPNDGILLLGPETPVSEQPLRYDFWGIEAREGRTQAPRLVVRWGPE